MNKIEKENPYLVKSSLIKGTSLKEIEKNTRSKFREIERQTLG